MIKFFLAGLVLLVAMLLVSKENYSKSHNPTDNLMPTIPQKNGVYNSPDPKTEYLSIHHEFVIPKTECSKNNGYNYLDQYDNQQFYLSNVGVYPTLDNYVKALSRNKVQETKYVINQRHTLEKQLDIK